LSHIQIIYSGVLSANRVLQKAIKNLDEIEDTGLALKNHVAPDIQSRYQIAERLRDCCQSAEAIHRMTGKVLEITSFGLQEYRNTEKQLRRAAPTDHDMLEVR